MELPLARNTRGHSSRVLLALAVFQDLRKMEYIRSIHVYSQAGTAFAVQQEFLLKAGAFSQISQPIQLACFCSLSSTGLKQFMAMMREMHDSEWWKCVLEFRVGSPCDTAMVPFLIVSRNPDFQSIPSLAEDLRLVETAVSGRATLSSSFAAVAETSDDCHGSYFHSKHWKHLKRRLPPLFYGSLPEEEGLTEHMDNGRGAESPDGVPQSLPLDIWQKWGSDLELAGPRTSETFDFAIPRGSISEPNLSLYTASTSPSSPISSSFSSQNGDSAFWVPSVLVESSPAMSDIPIERPRTHGNDFFPGEADIFISRLPISVVDKEAHVDSSPLESPSRCSMTNLQRKSIAPETCKSDLMPHAKRATSMCSETGVGLAEEVDGWYCPSKLSKRWVGMAESTGTAFLSEASNNGWGKGFREESGAEGLRVGKKRIKSEGWSHSRGSTEILTEMSMTELSHYFNMPISQACKELKVGLTVLKRRCREFGIPRWPHRKMKSLESLICNIQDLSKDDGGNHTDHVLHAVKELEEQRKAMEEKPGTELAERTKRLRQACFKASYKKRRKQQEAHYTSQDSEAAAYHSTIPNFTDSYNMLCPSSLICK